MSNLRIVHVRGDEPVKVKTKTKRNERIEALKNLIIEHHNRKFEPCK